VVAANVCLAGPIGEAKWLEEPEEWAWLDSAADDRNKADLHCLLIGKHVWDLADSVAVALDHHWLVVVALADELLRRRTLTGNAVVKVVAAQR
jgi:hypothetical protein